jgi:hypothetical protein
MLRSIILLILSVSFNCFAEDDLNYQLIMATRNNKLQEVMVLLDRGASPITHTYDQDGLMAPALHESAALAAMKGKDEIYSEFIRRGYAPNSIGIYKYQTEGFYSVWTYLIRRASFYYGDRAKFKTFFLRSLREGATFEPFSGTFSDLIDQGFEEIADELIAQNKVTRNDWLQFTSVWSSYSYDYRPEVNEQAKRLFYKYSPQIKEAGISINEWGHYDVVNGKLQFSHPIAQSYASSLKFDFLKIFINEGFDINEQINGVTGCDYSSVLEIEDAKEFIDMGCKPTNRWIFQVLRAEGSVNQKLAKADKLLTLGLDINDRFSFIEKFKGEHTLLTSMCKFFNSEDYKEKDYIIWALKKGANPNLASSEGADCMYMTVSLVYARDLKRVTGLIKDLVTYKADLNSIKPIYLPYYYGPLPRLISNFSRGSNTDQDRETIFQVIKTLLELGANPNFIPKDAPYGPYLALYGVADKTVDPALKAMNLLLDYGADPDRAPEYASPFHQLSLNCSSEKCMSIMDRILGVAPHLLNKRSSIWNEDNPPICYAIMQDNDKAVDYLIKKTADLTLKCLVRSEYKSIYQSTRPGSKSRKVLEDLGIKN